MIGGWMNYQAEALNTISLAAVVQFRVDSYLIKNVY